MKVRSSVFGSASERLLYKALQTRWSEQLNLYPCLPLMNIIEVEQTKFAPNETRYLRMTSVDYTLCDKSDRPMLSIEFDGLGEGFSRDGIYIPRYRLSKDPNREWKLNFKLKVCENVWYPLFIVAFEESRQLGPDLSLSVLDGIIGQFLARLNTQQRIDELADERREVIETASREGDPLDEFLSDLVIEAEVEMQMTWNPIRRKIHDFQDSLMQFDGRLSWSPKVLAVPEHIRTQNGHPHLSQVRLDAFATADKVGSEVTVHTSRGDVTEAVWIRNVPDWLTASIVGDEIAQLLAFKKAVDLFDQPSSRSA